MLACIYEPFIFKVSTMIIREISIREIMDYEILNNINIIEEIANLNFDVMHDVIKLAYNIDDDEAYKILEDNIETKGVEEVAKELCIDIIGREPSEKSDENVTEFKSFSDVLNDFYNQIQCIDSNLSLTDFWNLSTKYMYKYTDGLKDRYIFNLNKKSEEQFLAAEQLLGLLFGKIKKPIHFDNNGVSSASNDLKSKLLRLKNHQYD